jgi:hypothetical protein
MLKCSRPSNPRAARSFRASDPHEPPGRMFKVSGQKPFVMSERGELGPSHLTEEDSMAENEDDEEGEAA